MNSAKEENCTKIKRLVQEKEKTAWGVKRKGHAEVKKKWVTAHKNKSKLMGGARWKVKGGRQFGADDLRSHQKTKSPGIWGEA